ncbi:MAG: biopolymer transporter ExbD [Candidatus Firestonebacteria bacterium]|nr:biopolymer transporter ExbD [Candidatus Firestonebacteria bacterium]
MESGNRDSSEPIININVTPLVDVSLVLVIIFMVSAPLSMQSGIGLKTIKKEATNTETAASAAPEVRTEIMIKLAGDQVTVNDQITEEAKLPFLLTKLMNESKEKLVYITPAEDVQHGKLVQIMDLSRQCGAKQLAIVDEPGGNTETASAVVAAASPAVLPPPPAGGIVPSGAISGGGTGKP